ncbi:hypothetical protein JN853_00915 [Pseudomonas syringae pv. actinidiae ICMP 9853]|nr:hypothetical protein JN853_00915 [Pseudomonas syringae pv. actinidiae ICMP 9853]
MLDAPRHRSVPRRAFKIGRRASRTACDAERRTIIPRRKKPRTTWSFGASLGGFTGRQRRAGRRRGRFFPR